ncbi:MAG: 2-phospho-L-lactate guanylyltransferase [Candidatus Nanopelagicales bacterium]|nr:2-phospho-L-lactate guanylyltransferase [Candidatus Nanopelagicales bacterium]
MPPDSASEAAQRSVVIPVKTFARAKTRLEAPPSVRADLARALLLDVLAACRESCLIGEVVVVSAETTLSDLLDNKIKLILQDDDRGVNQAITSAIKQARLCGPVAVMVADIPCATGEQLDAILDRTGDQERWFVPDADSIGTVMLGSRNPAGLRPSMGRRSRANHLDTGAIELVDDRWQRLRRDVDTLAHLRAAVVNGAGTQTSAVARALGLVDPS